MKKYRYVSSGRFHNIFPQQYVNCALDMEQNLTDEQKNTFRLMRRRLVLMVPGLGNSGADEILLKLYSFINGETCAPS